MIFSVYADQFFVQLFVLVETGKSELVWIVRAAVLPILCFLVTQPTAWKH